MKTQLLSGIVIGGLAAALMSSNQANAADIRYQQSGDWFDTNAVTGSNGWQAPGIPGATDNARANWGGNTVTLSGVAPDINNAQIGVDESGTFEINSGGVLTTLLDVRAGNNQGNPLNPQVEGTLTVNSGGVVNVGRILWAACNDSNGFININVGGTVNVASHLWLGETGTAEINIAGLLNQTGGILGLGTNNASTATGGTATVTILDGGIMALNNISGNPGQPSIQPGSTINIQGSGQLTVNNDQVGNINGYIAAGLIGGNGTFDASALDVTFDGGSNKTIVTAIGVVSNEPFAATIIETGSGFDLSWNSQSGSTYNIRSSETLTGAPSSWTLVEGDIAATPPSNTKSLTPAETSLFYAVEEVTLVDLNASFENPTTSDAMFSIIGTPWMEEDPGGVGTVNTWNPAVPGDFVSIPDGDNVASIYCDPVPNTTFGIAQTLTETFATGTDYTVTVEVGNASTTSWSGFRVELWAGAILLASDEDPTTTAPTSGNWITSTVSYDNTTGPAATPGDSLEIRLLSRGVDVDGIGSDPAGWTVEFDNLTFGSSMP